MFQELVFALIALTVIFVMTLFGITVYWKRHSRDDSEAHGRGCSAIDTREAEPLR